jgi:hypothetical protein
MAENVTSILKRIANPFIFGNIFISACTLSLFLETYLQLGAPVTIDGLAMLVFFATLFLYNFHRLMGVRRIRPEDHGIITGWASKHRFSLFMLAIIGAGGVGFFVFQTSLTIFIVLAIWALYHFCTNYPWFAITGNFSGCGICGCTRLL